MRLSILVRLELCLETTSGNIEATYAKEIPQKLCSLAYSMHFCLRQRAIDKAGGSASGVHYKQITAE